MHLNFYSKSLYIALILSLFLLIHTSQLYAADWTIYDTRPDINSCTIGILSHAEKADVLNLVNHIRALHKLAPVVYAAEFDEETAQASLMMVANDSISHESGPSWHCYTEAGQKGLSTSNLYWLSINLNGNQLPFDPSSVDIVTWLIDDNVPWLGHRRWLLDPFLTQISYNRTDGSPIGESSDHYVRASALKIIYDEKPSPSAVPDFVAYPYGNYPQSFFQPDWFWSFSAVADSQSAQNSATVDFSQTTVRVTSERGEHRVHNQSFDNNFVGLPNFLQWMVDDVQSGEPYHVQIENVDMQGQLVSYSYDLTLVSESGARPEPIIAQFNQLPTPQADPAESEISSTDVAAAQLSAHVARLMQKMQIMGNRVVTEFR